jgi:hypothetical protein
VWGGGLEGLMELDTVQVGCCFYSVVEFTWFLTAHGKGASSEEEKMMTNRHQTITWGPPQQFLFSVFVLLMTDRHHSFFFSADSFPCVLSRVFTVLPL